LINYNDVKDLSLSDLLLMAKDYMAAAMPDDALRLASFALEQDVDHPQALFIAGQVFLESDKAPIAECLFRKALERDPMRGELWAAIGRSIDPYRRPEEAFKYLKRAHELRPDSTVPIVNVSNAYNLAGMFKEAKIWAQKALDLKPESVAANDNMGQAKLGLGDFTGFDGMNYGLGGKFRNETQYGDEGRWTGKKGETVIIYGEQGLGDEILYGSCLPDAIEDCKEVIVDCDRRLESLFKRSFPKAHVYGTRTSTACWPHKHTWDARCAMAALPMFYRRKKESFPGKPFLIADPIRRKQWRAVLDDLGPKPKIGITWSGGVKLTNRQSRSVTLDLFKPLLEVAELIDLSHEKKDYDLPIHRWDHATLTDNYDDTAGLVAELDLVITVCTSVVHLAGALGIPTLVLLPERPSWRYALDDMYWYDSVQLIKNEGWENSIQVCKTYIEEMEDERIAL
jgi:tetratricopeptide (TPR) repeat protein